MSRWRSRAAQTEAYHRRPSVGSAFHSSERIEEVTQVLGDCSAPGQVFIRDRGRAHRNDDRPDILMLPELSRIGPLRLHQSVPLSSGLQPFLSLAYGRHGCSPVLEGSITQDAPPFMPHCKHKALMKPERREAFPCFGPGPCKRTVPFCEGFQISAGRDGAPRPSWLTRLARRQPAPRAVGLAPASRNSNPAQAPATEGTTKKSQTCASAFPPTRTAGPKAAGRVHRVADDRRKDNRPCAASSS